MSAEFFDCAELALNGESGGRTAWANLGYWESARSYPDAAEALARQVADAAGLRAGDEVLDLGFGLGEQLRLWHAAYGVVRLLGCNPSASQLAHARRLAPDAYQLHRLGAEAVGEVAPAGSFDVALAVDCAYHFPGREQVFAALCRSLRPGGRLVLTDLLRPESLGPVGRSLMARGLGLARIPPANLVDWPGYEAGLIAAGFTQIAYQDLTDQVFAPFARWWRGYRSKVPRRLRLKFDVTATFLDAAARRGSLSYALISAVRPS